MGNTFLKSLLQENAVICRCSIHSLSSERMGSTEKSVNGGWMSVAQFI